MDKENALLSQIEEFQGTVIDFDEMERNLQSQLDSQKLELDQLVVEKMNIGNPEALGSAIESVIMDQIYNQIGMVAGKDFIEANNNKTLDLRYEAHVQTTENFEQGVIADHNTEIDFQQRYDDWQNSFQRNEDGSIRAQKDNRSGTEKNVLKKDARKNFDKDRPKGSKTIHKDHTISAAEIIRDPAANAHLTLEEQIDFANSDKNLNDLDASANESKGDSTMEEWLNSEREGQNPAERFNIDEEDLREKDRIAREEYEKRKKEGEQRTIEAGKLSRKKEAFRIGEKALRAAVMGLLTNLVKEMIGALVRWFRSGKKTLETFFSEAKKAIGSFARNLTGYMVSAGQTILTTIISSLYEGVVRSIQKVWTLLKEGWSALKKAIAHIKDPKNSRKTTGELAVEVGKIFVGALTAVGALVFSEIIEKGLMTIPILAWEIPLLGSLASILGIFSGAVSAGIIGALVLHFLDKLLAKKRKSGLVAVQLDKGNEILATQRQIVAVNSQKFVHIKGETAASITDRHAGANEAIQDAINEIFSEDEEETTEELKQTDMILDKLGKMMGKTGGSKRDI